MILSWALLILGTLVVLAVATHRSGVGTGELLIIFVGLPLIAVGLVGVIAAWWM